MGGDHSPKITTRGAVLAAHELPDPVQLVLFGNAEEINACLIEEGVDLARFQVVGTTDDITMQDHPTKALQAKPSSSIAQGFRHLVKGDIQAFASTGNTGAMMVGSLFSVKTIEGVSRPCITTVVPKEDGSSGILLDIGSNADVKAETLCEWGVIGSLMAQHVHHIENPKVALLSIGEEEKKGNIITQAAHQLLKAEQRINFIGNVEGRDLFNSKADVVICDGFTGNIVLKTVEGFYELLKKQGVNKPFFDRFNYQHYGGTPILGVNGNVIIGHGISDDVTIKNMILLAHEVVESNLAVRIKEAFNG